MIFQSTPIAVHGDAAVAGQGILYEIVQMAQLDGYKQVVQFILYLTSWFYNKLLRCPIFNLLLPKVTNFLRYYT
jgi:hypothetical protein